MRVGGGALARLALHAQDRPAEEAKREGKPGDAASQDPFIRELIKHPRRATIVSLPVVMDVADEAQAEALIAQTVREFGRVDFLINNAAAARGDDRVPVVDMDVDTWDLVIRVKLRGGFLMSRAFAREMIQAQRPGAIINISSIAGKRMGPNTTAYSASNAGIQALSSGMSGELGPHGIRVNTICPGIIDTSRLDDMGRDARWQQAIANVPMRRASDGSDIANMAVYLCSDQGNWVNGQAINVDGGSMTAH